MIKAVIESNYTTIYTIHANRFGMAVYGFQQSLFNWLCRTIKMNDVKENKSRVLKCVYKIIVLLATNCSIGTTHFETNRHARNSYAHCMQLTRLKGIRGETKIFVKTLMHTVNKVSVKVLE